MFSLLIVSKTWLASSLVGHTINPLVFLLTISLFNSGIVNANVLPVPV